MKVKNYSTEDNQIRLTRYRKKGLLRVLFSRMMLIGILVVLQALILAFLLVIFTEFVTEYTVMMRIFVFFMVIYLFNSDMDSSAKLTWLMLISIFPIPGSTFFFFTQTEVGHRNLKKRMIGIMKNTKNAIKMDENVYNELEQESLGVSELCNYVNKTGCFPIFKNSSVDYYPSGEEFFVALEEELKKAEKFIFIEYFIIAEGYMWGRVLKTLVDKAKEGVEVRVMYDGMCEMKLLPHDYADRLRQLGLQAKKFAPIRPFISTYYNYRDHRKVFVIDGKVAFGGGVNLADEYINKIERFGYWKDTAVMVKGEAVKAYTLMFLQMWASDGSELELKNYLDDPEVVDITPDDNLGYVMPYSDIPLDDEKVGENVYMDVLNRATDYVHIMTPYLVLDDETLNVIKYTANRGVDVKIILPGIPDKKVAYSLAKTHYKSLLKSGVKLYEYTPGFVHAKSFVCDDKKAIVGSINLDYRSLYHHFECATYMYKSPAVMDVEKDFQETLSKCKQVTFESVEKDKLYYKIVGGLVKTIAPLM